VTYRSTLCSGKCGGRLLLDRVTSGNYKRTNRSKLEVYYSESLRIIKLDGCIVWNAHNTALGSNGSLVWQTVRVTDRPTDYSVRRGVIMRSYVGYGKATHSFHASTNNFATTKSLSVRSKHLIKYLV